MIIMKYESEPYIKGNLGNYELKTEKKMKNKEIDNKKR